MKSKIPPTKLVTTERVKRFIEFCFRDDIANQLANSNKPHLLAVKLYYNETGIKISARTALNQQHKWIIINGQICQI